MLNFRCDQCNQKLSISESRAGGKVKCSRCAAIVVVPQLQKLKIVKSRTQAPAAEKDQTTPETGTLEEGIKKGSDASTDSDSYELQDNPELHDPQPFNNSFQDNQNHNSASGIGLQTINEEGVTKQCPHCGGIILAIAKKCKHCREFLHQNAEILINQHELPVQQVWTDNNTQPPKIAPVNGAYCPSCKSIVSNMAIICPSCGIELHAKKESDVSTGLLIAGWIGVFFFTPLGLIVGIICCSKGKADSGVLMIILSIVSALIGIAMFVG